MSIENALASVAVKDLGAAEAWYTKAWASDLAMQTSVSRAPMTIRMRLRTTASRAPWFSGMGRLLVSFLL